MLSIAKELAPSNTPNKTANHDSKPKPTIGTLVGDPAIFIGLALSYVRQCNMAHCSVPSIVQSGLRSNAQCGDPASRLVLGWFERHHWFDPDRSINSQASQAELPDIVSANLGEVHYG